MERGVALAGFMGIGKSTVGAALAPRLGLRFVDLDERIEAEAGCSVSEIFAREGEPGFRAREARAVQALSEGPPIVLALGGGTLHHLDNLTVLQRGFHVVSLVAPLEEIRDRVGTSDAVRPLWADAASRYAERAEGYRRADAVADVSGLDVDGALRAVLEVLPCE